MLTPKDDANLLRRFTQEDLLASGIRAALSVAGPVGTIVGEFLTQFVPAQRLDRLQQFVESLHERLSGLEEQFKERLNSDPAFASLVEEASIAAVSTASDSHRDDLTRLLKHGLSRDQADLIEEQALMRLRNRLNDAQVILLMSYGNFKRTMGDAELKEFWDQHPGLFSAHPPTMTSPPEERRRWTMREHYAAELEALSLLRDTEGIVKSGQQRKYQITALGRLLLAAIGRYRDPNATD
jgi:hypothetical protein